MDRSINSFLVPHIHALNDAGHHVEVACRLGEVAGELRAKGIVAHHIDFEQFPFHWRNVKAFRQLKRLIDHHQYDVVHTHMPTSGALGRIAAAAAGTPAIIYTAHGFHFYDTGRDTSNAIFHFIERNLARISTAIITINGDDFAAAQQWTNPGKQPYVYYIPGVGINVSSFGKDVVFDTPGMRQAYRADLGIAPDELVVGTIGSCTTRKRHSDLIRAVAHLNENSSGPRVLIVGDGPLLESEKMEARRLGLENQCLFLGHSRDIPQLLAVMDIYVQSSLMEGLPVSVMEAMASGLPIVGSNARGTRDLVSDKESGLLFPVGDVRRLSGNLRTLLLDRQLRIKMGRQGKSDIQNYDQNSINLQLLEVYEELAILSVTMSSQE